jgi:alkylation response protein AidB-like acyl-CoA dehydrogenase
MFMSAYKPPVQDMMFVLNQVIGFDRLPQAAEIDEGTMQAILDEAAKLASDVLAPLYASGDKEGCIFANGEVKTPKGFKEAYRQYRDAGWNGVPFHPEHGGQGLPWALGFAIQEMWQGSNMAFGLCPMLTQAAVEALEVHGTQEQKDKYLTKLVSGEWTGTMQLTESQAGTDLAALKTKAVKQPDGSYRITGQKIYITYGEHDFADNIIHAVLARVPGAPEGVKGISLFLVPKVLDDGNRNDVKAVGIEHKLGIHASPTCTMQYGEQGGAVGFLIGQENDGLKCMFTMMNNARLSVGLQGVAIAEAAFQHALKYAKERVQGTAIGDKTGARVAIIEHPDVRRMLLTMKAKVEAGRAMTYAAALAMDLARAGDKASQAKVDLLTPIVKAWCTDIAVEVASLGVQVHGGMGFVEETGAAQFYRDARILPIYEGTNGIQALDLSMRKVLMDGGHAANACFDEIEAVIAGLDSDPDLVELRQGLERALSAVRGATATLLVAGKAGKLEDVAAVNVPYLNAFGTLLGGAMMARSALMAIDFARAGGDPAFCQAKRMTAVFYAAQILPQVQALTAVVEKGGASVTTFGAEFL